MKQKLMYHETWELTIVYFLKIEMAEPDFKLIRMTFSCLYLFQ